LSMGSWFSGRSSPEERSMPHPMHLRGFRFPPSRR
jgi:hypothetical protein